MNLFDKIIQSQFNNFTGQAQPQVPSFDTPQAPRTTNYTQPNIPTATVKKTSPVVRNGGFAPWYEWTVDETQSWLFKVIQGGADLFTGIKKRLGETVQEDKTRFDTEMSQKRQQFISDMLAKGKKKEDIFSALDSLKAKWEFDFKPWISESIVGGVGNRMQTIENETTRLSQIQDPLARTTAGILPYAGQTVAWALEPITSALEPFVSPVVKAVIDKTGQTENIQELSQWWSEFEKTNPILAWNIEGLLNVSQLAPLPFAKPVWNAIKKGTVETGKAIVRGAEYVAPKVVEWVKKITPSLPKWSDISTRANRFIAWDEQKFVKEIKETPWEFATSRGMKEVWEKAIEKAQQNFERSKAEADTSFEAIQGKFSTKWSSNDIVWDLLKANKEKMDAQPRNKDRVRVDELFAKYESNEWLSMSEINEAKRIHARNHTYSYEQRTSNEARNASDIQNDIRDWQFQTAKENWFTNADKVNMETKWWKMFADSLAKKMDRSGANNSIGITDWIVLSGGNPTNIALFLGKKVASSNIVKTGAIKLLSKQTKPSIIKGTKADIQQANFEKNVNRGISSDRNSVGGESMVTPAWLIEAPTWQVTGAKNFRVNQQSEKPPIKNEWQVWVRPGSKSQAQIKEEVQLAKQATRQSELKLITDDIASATERARYGGTGNTRIETQLNGKMDAWKLTREEAIDIATEILQDVQKKWISSKYKYIDSPKLEEYINDLYSNKKMPTFDDLLNESKPIVTPPSNAKQQGIKPVSSDTIPEGYFKNAFWEIQKNPSNKKGGFIRNPFAKIEPKRLFAGENSAQPPKSKTGWFKWADGKMRFEIDDSQWKIVWDFADKKWEIFWNKYTYKTVRLWDLLKHDELYKQYPELKNIRVEINSKMWNWLDSGDARWKDSPVWDSPWAIQFNENRINRFKWQSEYAKKRTLEIRNTPEYKKYYKEVENLEWNDPKFDEITKKFDNTELWKEYAIVSKDSSTYNDNFKSYLLHEIQHAIQTKENFAKWDSALSWIENYTNSAWEVEARNVQSRMWLTAKQRTIKKPVSTEDVPRAKQIIRMDSKWPSLLKIPEIGKKSEGIKVYKWVNWEWTWKKFPLDYFTTDKKSASQYWKEVIETTIYPKKIADFTNPSNKAELRKILRDNLNPKIADEFIDRAMEWKDSFSYPLYEMVENPKVTQALKDAWYDATKYLDYGNKNSKFARHETIAMLDVKPINKSIPVKNPLVEEAIPKSKTAKSNAKQQVIKPKSTTTNVFGETIDKPSNKKGGFIKIPEIGKKSEIKPEIEKYLKTQNIYDKKQWEYGTILKKLSEEYSDWKWWISDEWRLLPKYKEAKKNFDYYFKLLQDFNWLESSKKASKEFNKLWIVERQKIRRQINETKSKINVNDNPVWLVSDSNKSIVKNPLVEEARKYTKWEDFMKSKIDKEKPVTMYRTSKSWKAHWEIKDFTYFSPSKEYIKQYLRDWDTIVEYKLKPSQIMQYTKDWMEYQYLPDTRNPKILEMKELWKKANSK